MMQRFTAACAQFAITPMDATANIAKAGAWVQRAADQTGAQLIVLPETVTTGFVPTVGPLELWDAMDEIPGRLSEPIQKAAQAVGAYVVLPSYERGPQRGVVYNSAALLGPNGDVLGIYRKTHLFPTERINGPAAPGAGCSNGWSTPGHEPVVIQTPLAAIGITICYDGDFPELYRAEAIMGAEVIVRPSALLRSFEIWELTNRARAYDNHVYMVSCNAVGPDAGGNYYFGHSMIVSPIAHKLAQARGTEEVAFAELDPDPIKFITYGTPSPMIFDHLRDRNLAAYQNILTPAHSRFEPARRS
ncbi:carbon-nitrogen hydrolase family protein [Candidatus Amarolinea dominans]|uniref:carbon-nitrogen hydrolase family protein n=1 Tax=Candidatus Amarolinea dominans TaxID=3140696 RepID=UPI0031CC3AD6